MPSPSGRRPAPRLSLPGAQPGRRRRLFDDFLRHRAAFGLGLLFLVLTQAFALSVPWLLEAATNHLVASEIDEAGTVALGLVAVAALGAVARVLSRIYIFEAGRQVEHRLRQDLYAHLETLGPDFFDRMPKGQVMSRMTNDLTQVRLLLGPGLLNLTNTALVYGVVIPLLLFTDPVLTLAALSVLPVLVLLGRVFAKRIYPLSVEAQERLGTLSSRVQENLSGLMTVRAYRREAAEERRFDEVNRSYLEVNLALARLRGLLFPLMGMFGGVGGVIVLALAGPRIASGEMSVGGFVKFNAYLAALTWPTIALGWMISLWQRGRASMTRVNEIFEAVPSLSSGPTEDRGPGRIEIEKLRFTYPGASRPALDGVSLVVEPGERVAIVGPTGAGKSTLLELIARLHAVPPGSIRLDGRDVNELSLPAVRDRIAYAPQDAFLFSRSIAENVAFGRPSAHRSDLEDALREAALDLEVEAFPEGLDTVVGERGLTLSGGQRQRATLARALAADRPILLLDDTLSAVDTETEGRILDNLFASGRTVVLATHRLAGAARADRIAVLEEGRVVELGTEPELLELGGVYAQMHRRQRVRSRLEGHA